MQSGYSYRIKDAKVGVLFPLVVHPDFIYPTAQAALDFMNENLRDPQDFAVLEGEYDAAVKNATGRHHFWPRRVVPREEIA